MPRKEAEAQATALWQSTPVDQRTMDAPPTCEEMLVGGSEASVEIHWTDGIDDTALTEFARLARDYDVD